ncbi:Rad52/Rad22 family DNA repair protein [Bacillus salitolerans]|uniref:Rad52/Rad22 family DNA repair protein n=1 Tax=Bacillus salitolerans TaxID=1437434 RepID=A0ABW4LMY3_9BACI
MTNMQENCTNVAGNLNGVMELLQAPFEAKDVEWRVQRTSNDKKKAAVAPYISNRAIMNRLDQVFGFSNWKNEFYQLSGFGENYGVKCRLWVKINDEWIFKEDGCEFKVSDNNDKVDPIKTAYSNSMKRCAVHLGIGRYLYNLNEQWVPLKDSGQNYQKVNGQPKYWDNPQLPSWALPIGEKQSQKNDQHQETSQKGSKQSSNQGQRGNSQQHSGKQPPKAKEFNREEVLKIIDTHEKIVGLHKNQKYKTAIFTKANPNTRAKEISKGTQEELRAYFKSIKPVSDIVATARKNGISIDKALEYCQIVLPNDEISQVENLYFRLDDGKVAQVIEMIGSESKVKSA